MSVLLAYYSRSIHSKLLPFLFLYSTFFFKELKIGVPTSINKYFFLKKKKLIRLPLLQPDLPVSCPQWNFVFLSQKYLLIYYRKKNISLNYHKWYAYIFSIILLDIGTLIVYKLEHICPLL